MLLDNSHILFLCFYRFIANAGDARAVLGVQEEDGSFSALTLSNDHNAQNEDEVTRIRDEHPPSERKTVIRQVLHLLISSTWLLLQHFVKTLPFFFRTGCWASSCHSVHLGMWNSSGVLSCRSVCLSLDPISSMKMSTQSLSPQTITHPHTWPLSQRSRTTNCGHRIASWWEKKLLYKMISNYDISRLIITLNF